MKFALNGALTIGTLDGANIEIMEEVGKENIFIFGMTTEEVQARQMAGYRSREIYEKQSGSKTGHRCDFLRRFFPSKPDLFKPIVDSLLNMDSYMLFADFDSYRNCQQIVAQTYMKRDEWIRKSILNVSHMGKFSSDRTIAQYARDIWNAPPVPVHWKRKNPPPPSKPRPDPQSVRHGGHYGPQASCPHLDPRIED